MRRSIENQLFIIALSCAEIEGLRARVTVSEKENEILKFNSEIDSKNLENLNKKLSNLQGH